MPDYSELLDSLRAILDTAINPVILCSFGQDSLLLLHAARQLRPDISILWLREHLTREQRAFPESVIKAQDLAVLGMTPIARTLVASDAGLTVVREYDFNGDSLPLLADVVPGDRCIFKLPRPVGMSVPLPFDVALCGWKVTDYHSLLSQMNPQDGDEFGGIRCYFPLRFWTDEQVAAVSLEQAIPRNEAKYAGDDQADPDCLSACTRCVNVERAFCPEMQQEIQGCSILPISKNY